MFEEYCNKCGECCKNQKGILVTPEDLELWKALGRNDIIDAVEEIEEDYYTESGILLFRKGEMILPTDKNERCIFLTKDNKCSIYNIRPKLCWMFPYRGDGLMIYPKSCNVIKHLYFTEDGL